MFREQYKAAFNSITADRTQIDKIFDIAEKTTENKPKIVPFKYAGTLVAVLIIVIAAAMFPNFSEFFGTEETDYSPVGIVNYGADKTWNNTEITGGSMPVSDETAAPKTENVAVQKRELTAENEKTSQKEAVYDESVNESTDLSNIPAVAMLPQDNNEAVSEEMVEEKPQNTFMMKASGSSAAFSLVEETLYDLVNGSVTMSVYSRHSEIESVLNENSTNLIIISESIAYAERDGLFYKFTADGLSTEEFEQFINEKL